MMPFNQALPIHPARALPFAELAGKLSAAVDKGLVRATERDGATLYCYTKDCVYNRAWDDVTTLARGLILDHAQGKVIATPFPKFFNVGERAFDTLPDLPFETFEKMDGSLIIVYWHREQWRAATKGSLNSDQAQWAERELGKVNQLHFYPGATYLCEAIYPDNRIVIHYPFTGLVLLAAYADDGRELAYRNVRAIAGDLGWRTAHRYEYAHVSDLMARALELPVTEEGFVLRFSNGLRLKLKGDEYCRVHRLISGCTPLALWETMLHGDNLAAIRKDLPEEFWPDFDKITGILAVRLATFVSQVETAVASVADLDNKELGLTLKTRIPGPWADFVFHCRKHGNLLPPCDPSKANPVPMIRRSIFDHVRPTGNRLDGYTPSSAVHRVQEDVA